jgi:hypothetical protein
VKNSTKDTEAEQISEEISEMIIPEFVEELPPPTPRKRYRGKYADFADTLRENAGRWAKYPSQTKTTIYQLRKSRLGSFPGDEFEFESRGGHIYLRYVGTTTLEDILNAAEAETDA